MHYKNSCIKVLNPHTNFKKSVKDLSRKWYTKHASLLVHWHCSVTYCYKVTRKLIKLRDYTQKVVNFSSRATNGGGGGTNKKKNMFSMTY